jgi:hypothetical protein
MDAWKASGRGKASVDAKLWGRFKAAQDQFFAAKNSDLDKRQVTMAANLAKREELIVKFEEILPITDLQSAKKNFRALMEQWQKIGMTERSKRAALDTRLSRVEDELHTLTEEQNRRTDPTAIARANDVVQGLIDAIAGYEAQAEKAEAATRTSRAPRSTPHCVHPSNEHPRTVKDRFEPFPRRAGAVPTTLSTRDPDRGAGTVRGYFVLRSNSIKFKRRTQMRETRVLKTTDVSRSVPVAVSRPQPG